MKTFRFLIFVPVFFGIVLLSRVVEKPLFNFIGDFYNLDRPLWTHFLIQFISLIIGLIFSLTIYPIPNKKIGFTILTVLVLVNIGNTMYYVFLSEGNLDSNLKKSVVLDVLAHLLVFIYFFIKLKKNNYHLAR